MKAEPATLTSPAAPTAAEGEAPRSFSGELQAALERFEQQPLSVGAFLASVNGRSIHLLLVLLALPFLTPLPLPGFSIPFGLVAVILGESLVTNRPLRLPGRIRDGKFPAAALAKFIRAARGLVRLLEAITRPRGRFMRHHVVIRRLAGVQIALCGALLIVPLPIPFGNFLPAATILLLSVAEMARDGLLFIGGCLAFCVTLGFFALLGVGGAEAAGALRGFLLELWRARS